MFIPLKAFSCGETAGAVREVSNHGVGIDCGAEAHPGFIPSTVEVDRHDEIHIGEIVLGWHPTSSASGRLESARVTSHSDPVRKRAEEQTASLMGFKRRSGVDTEPPAQRGCTSADAVDGSSITARVGAPTRVESDDDVGGTIAGIATEGIAIVEK